MTELKNIEVSPLDLAKTICIFNDYNAGQVPAGEFAPENLLKLAREVVRLSIASADVTPSDEEVAAYRDLFRAELAKRMDTKYPSASPSTESHTIALTAFLKKRGAPSATAYADTERLDFLNTGQGRMLAAQQPLGTCNAQQWRNVIDATRRSIAVGASRG